MNYTLTVENGTVFALCSTNLESVEECSIQYGRDPNYQNLSSPIRGPVNSRFPIDDEQEDVHHHQTTMRVNSFLEIIIRSTFVYSSSSITDENIMKTTANFRTFPLTDHNTPNDVKVMGITLVSWQLGLIGCVFTILMMGLTTSIIVIIVLLRKGNYTL